ncbi:MAG TPA: hypothetical protein PKD55_26210 [Bellilinea sp.]|nr:hypothetical protein [Bellilinea sp.]
MNVSDLVLPISSSIVAVGWFVTGYVNHRNHIATKRLEHRLDALKTAIHLLVEIGILKGEKGLFESDEQLQQFNRFQLYIILYGEGDERELTSNMIQYLVSKSRDEFWESHQKLLNLLRTRLRKELGMSKQPLSQRAP